MKHFFKSIHITSRFFLAIFTALLIFFLTLAASLRALTPMVPLYREPLTQLASQWLDQPLAVQQLNLHWRELEPVLDFGTVKLLSEDKSRVLFQIEHLQLGVNWSETLWRRTFVLDDIYIRGVTLNIQQLKNGQFVLDDLSNLVSQQQASSPIARINEIRDWLVNERYIGLHNIDINITDKNGRLWQLRDLDVRWHQWFLGRAHLHGEGYLIGKKPTTVDFSADFSGDLMSDQHWRAHANIALTHLELGELNTWVTLPPTIQLQQGVLSGVFQIDTQGLHIQKIKAQLAATKLQTVYKKIPIDITNFAGVINWEQLDNNNWRLDAQLKNASWQPTDKIPGATHLNLSFTLTPDNGSLFVRSHDTLIDFGGIFAKPLALTQLHVQTRWEKKGDQWDVQSPSFVVQNSDLSAKGAFRFHWQPTVADSAFINLNSSFQLNPSVVNHLSSYLPQPLMSPGLIHWLTQSIKKIQSGRGTLVWHGQVSQFPYVNTPGEFHIAAQLNNATLNYQPGWPSITQLNAKLIFDRASLLIQAQSLQTSGVSLQNVSASIPQLTNPLLQVSINNQLPAPQALQFVQHSPLKDTVGKTLKNLQLEGLAGLQLQLSIPLSEKILQPIKVNGTLNLPNNTLTLPQWNIALPKLQGVIQFTEEGITAPQLKATLFGEPITINIKSPTINASSQLVLTQLPPAIQQQIKDYASGKTNYQLTIQLAKTDAEQNELNIDSDLQGIALDLPLNLSKTADEKAASHVRMFFGDHQLTRYQIEYKDLWLELTQFENGTWHAIINNPIVTGRIDWTKDFRRQGVQGHLRYVHIDKSITTQSSSTVVKPQNIPPLDFVINDFRYHGMNFGRVDLQTIPLTRGMLVQELKAAFPGGDIAMVGNWLTMENNQDKVAVQGNMTVTHLSQVLKAWNFPDVIKSNKGLIQFKLYWPGKLYSPTLQHMTGDITLDMGDGEILNLGGSSQAAMDFGRLLNILSVESIAQRLQFKFKDLTQKGLSFYSIKGQFHLANGQLWTNKMSIEGAVVDIDMTGSIDLTHETYNLQFAVTPDITSSIPVIAAIAGGPIVGAVTWAASKIINPVLDVVTTDHYTVTGSWQNPQIKKV